MVGSTPVMRQIFPRGYPVRLTGPADVARPEQESKGMVVRTWGARHSYQAGVESK